MNIIHICVAREFTAGQLKQLGFEDTASAQLPNGAWTTLGLQTGPSNATFVRQIPWLFRPIFLRNLYGWMTVRRLSRQYDFVFLRHMGFDPFAFVFAPLFPNRMSVHHAKEIDELKLIRTGWKGKAASLLEHLSGKFVVSRSRAIIGVTREIAEYERDLHRLNLPVHEFPNGIDETQISILKDKRNLSELNIAFMCGTFSAWHGLDLLIDSVDAVSDQDVLQGMRFHLIGTVPEPLLKRVKVSAQFICYGRLKEADYKDVLSLCDIGLGSLAMFRQGLSEGATLKNREMLCLGLPVYSTHKDTAFQDPFQFYHKDDAIDLEAMRNFAMQSKRISRKIVRDQSIPHIQKKQIMIRTIDFLKGLD